MDLTIIWLVIALFAVIIFLGVMKKQGKLTEIKFAVILIAYWSYFSLSAMHFFSYAWTSKHILLFGLSSLLVWWTLGYQFARWLYRQFN